MAFYQNNSWPNTTRC